MPKLPHQNVNQTAAAGLDELMQCVSATPGDFDNDGDVDLYLACRTGASNTANLLFVNQGNGTFVKLANAGGAAGPVGIAVESGAGVADSVVSGDYDVDGFLDLFVTNGFNLRPLGAGGPNKLFRNKGNANNWVQLDLVGKNSDRDAVGARISAWPVRASWTCASNGRAAASIPSMTSLPIRSTVWSKAARSPLARRSPTRASSHRPLLTPR